MDVHLANGCGVLSPQWLVNCDAATTAQTEANNAFENLLVVTSDGQVINSSDQTVDVPANVDSLEILFS